LSHGEVLAAALALIDADGVEALSMRRLGKALGRDPMRVYRYASSKAALLDGVVEFVVSELTAAAPHDGDWTDGLRRTAHAFRALALAHPHVVPLMVTRPLATPLALRPLGTVRLVEELLDLLSGAGFDGIGALHAYRLYIGFLYGHVLNELQEHELQERAQHRDERDDLARRGLYRSAVHDFPRLRGLAGELAGYDGARELDEGIDIIVAGLHRRLA
jgi:AcrR family transcriptional regulator